VRANGGTRKPSAHTLKAYRQDFDAIATLVAGEAAGTDAVGRHHDRLDAHGVRSVRGNPRGRIDSTVLIDMERVVHLPLHLGAHRGQPDAVGRLILTALLAGLRADELLRANVGDLRPSEDGAVIHVRGEGGKDRRIPIEPPLVEVLEHYLDSRATRFPTAAKKRSSPYSPAAIVKGDLTA
jgi:integrase